jgi:hypothetical protein
MVNVQYQHKGDADMSLRAFFKRSYLLNRIEWVCPEGMQMSDTMLLVRRKTASRADALIDVHGRRPWCVDIMDLHGEQRRSAVSSARSAISVEPVRRPLPPGRVTIDNTLRRPRHSKLGRATLGAATPTSSAQER